MNTDELTSKELDFSKKYDQKHALAYFNKHQQGLWRRLSDWREQALARHALKLAGSPDSVLDLPCGTGRFWSLLAEQPHRQIYACDYSQHMIDTGLQYRPADIVSRITAFPGSAFAVPVTDNFVDSVFCVRLLHHIGESQDRLAILKELHRVTRNTVIVSLWVDGNLKARRRKRLEASRKHQHYQNRFVIPAKQIEDEMRQSGFNIIGKNDFLPGLSMWRFYILKKS